jgi:hypothetical protein
MSTPFSHIYQTAATKKRKNFDNKMTPRNKVGRDSALRCPRRV